MLETVRRLKINKVYEGEACRWCGNALALGEDGAICESCHSPHHARCWDQQNGCNGDTSCINRPLQQLAGVATTAAPPKPARTLNPGESHCPTCGDVVSGVCFRCRQPVSIAGTEYTGVRTTAPEAKEALTYAIVGLLCCQLLGIVAIMKGTSAKQTIAINPQYDGEAIATAAQIIGGIQLGLLALSVLGALVGER